MARRRKAVPKEQQSFAFFATDQKLKPKTVREIKPKPRRRPRRIEQGPARVYNPGYDPTQNYHGGNSESSAAFESLGSAAAGMRAAIVARLRSRGEHTCDELEVVLGLRHQTASARCSELLAMGSIERTGYTRETRSGRKAAVLRVVEDAKEMTA